ncbi:MAG: hypothetical protein ACRD50_11020 [Candidatus Acidiferrales bacterium]
MKVFLLNEFGELSMRQKSSNAPDAGWSGWKALPWLDHRFVDIAAAEDANTVVFGTAQDNGKIFWTQNSGLESDGSVSWAPWQEIHTLFPKCAVAAIARSDGTFQVFALQCLGGIDDPRGQNGGGTTVWVGRGTPTGLTDPVNWQSFGNPMRWRTPTVSPDTFSARWLSVGLLTDARLQVWATGEAILGSDPKTPNITTWETEVSRWGLAANFVDWREFSAPDDLASLP